MVLVLDCTTYNKCSGIAEANKNFEQHERNFPSFGDNTESATLEIGLTYRILLVGKVKVMWDIIIGDLTRIVGLICKFVAKSPL